MTVLKVNGSFLKANSFILKSKDLLQNVIYKNLFSDVDSAEIYGGPASYNNLFKDSFGVLFDGYNAYFIQNLLSFTDKLKFRIKFEKSTTNSSMRNTGQFCGFWRMVSFNYVRYDYDNRPKTILQIYNVDRLTYYGNYSMSSHDGAPFYTYYLLQNNPPPTLTWEEWEVNIDYENMIGEILLNGEKVCDYTLKDASIKPTSGAWEDQKYEGIKGVPHYVRNVLVEAF